MKRLFAVFLTFVLFSIELAIAQNLPYPVRELLRRMGDRPAQIAQMAQGYEQAAQSSGYKGPLNGGSQAKQLALSTINSLKTSAAPMEHPKIVAILNSLNDSLARIETVDQKVLAANANGAKTSAQSATPKRLSYPVREALRRQNSNVSKIQQLVASYESQAAAAGYVGNFADGEEVKSLSESVMGSLRGANADMSHPKILAVTRILDDAKARVTAVDSKVTKPAGIKPAAPGQSASTQVAATATTSATQSTQATQGKKLPYPAREAVRRQTANVTTIETKLEKAKADAAKPLSPIALRQQQMLQQMLVNNPNLKSQLDANPSMLNQVMGASPIGLDGMEDQRLQSAMQDLQSSGAPVAHPEVASLIERIKNAQQGMKDLQRGNLDKMLAAKKANSLDDFPDFRKNLQLVKSREHKFHLAKKDVSNLNKLLQEKHESIDRYYQNPSHSIPTERLVNIINTINDKKIFADELASWTKKYQPAFDRNPNYKAEWTRAANSLKTLFPVFEKFDSALIAKRFVEMHEHNDAVIRDRVTKYFRRDREYTFYSMFKDKTTQQDATKKFNEFVDVVINEVVASNKVIRNSISLLGAPARTQLAQVNKKQEEMGKFMQKSAGIYFANGHAYKERIAAEKAERELELAERIQKLKDEREKRWEYAHIAHDPKKYEVDYLGVKDEYKAGDRESVERAARLNMPEAGKELNIVGYIIPANWNESLLSERIEVWVGEKLDGDYVILSAVGLKRSKDKRDRFEASINHTRDTTMSIKLFKSLMK